MVANMKKILEIFMIFIIFFTMISYTNISFASDLNDLTNEQSSVNSQINDAKKDLEEINTAKSENLKQIETLLEKISSYQDDIDELNSKISDLKSQINDMEKQIKQDEEEYNKQRELLDERIVASYKTGNTSYLDFLLSSSNIMDMISSYFLISKVADYDQNLMEEVNTHKEKIEADKKKIEENKQELETSQKAITAKQQSLQVIKKEKEAYSAKLSEEEKETEEKLQDLQAANKALEKKIKAKKAEIEAAKKASQSKNNSSSNSKSNSTPSSYGLIWPTLTKYSITTTWYYSTGALHGASDISGSGIYGTPVYAAADGYVINSDWGIGGHYQGYGNCIFIAHFNGLYTLYAHLSSRNVSEGQTVSQGQIIGYVGSTGNSTGPHLHFEVRTGSGSYSERVNPINYISKN